MRFAESAGPASDPRGASSVQGYRLAVEKLTLELESLGPDIAGASDSLWRTVREPDVHALLAATPKGPAGVHASCMSAYTGYERSATSNASSPATLVKILMLQLIDLAWWSRTNDFEAEHDVRTSPELVNLVTARANGQVAFAFKVGSDSLTRRIRNRAIHRLRPDKEPRTAGLALPYARPEMLALLNEITVRFQDNIQVAHPTIWVTSMTRSVAHQMHLQTLGYSAFLPSAHCRGWAADIEMAYLDRFDASPTLKGILQEYRDAGVLNVIDEGRAWHVCLNPEYADKYRAAARDGGFATGSAD